MMGLFGTSRSLKYDFSRGRDEVRARTRAEFLAAAGTGFRLVENDATEISDADLDMLAAAGDIYKDPRDTEE